MPSDMTERETAHPLTDSHIAEFWPDMATPEGRANIRRQFDTLMDHLARSKPRPFPRHPELMASIVAEKSQLLPERIEALRHGLAGLPAHWAKLQWRADDCDLFGERYVRFYGDDGHGMGRQAILAVCSGFKAYFGTLAHFIAAANPDTIRMLLAEREALQRERDEAVKALETARAAASDPAPATDDRVEAVAAAMWKEEAREATPRVIWEARTLDAFRETADDNRHRWKRFARAMLATRSSSKEA